MKHAKENSGTGSRFGEAAMPGVENVAQAKSLEMAAMVVRRVVAVRYDRPSLVSELACRIGAEIINWMRKPGDDLNSVVLSARYETSRVSTREALMLLEKEGLVEIPARRRPRVAQLHLDEIREIYKARIALIQVVSNDVALRATATEIGLLEDQAKRMRDFVDANNADSYLWESVEFHEMNTKFSGNTVIKQVLDSLLLRTLALRHLGLSQPGGIERSCRDHFNLVQAYKDRDPILAGAIIRSNLANALMRIETALASTPLGD